jgi:hypothetical protein
MPAKDLRGGIARAVPARPPMHTKPSFALLGIFGAVVLGACLLPSTARAQCTTSPVPASGIHIRMFKNGAIPPQTTDLLTSSDSPGLTPSNLQFFNHAHCVCKSPLVATINVDMASPAISMNQFVVSAWVGQSCNDDLHRSGTQFHTCQQVMANTDLYNTQGARAQALAVPITTDELMFPTGCDSPTQTSNFWVVIAATNAPTVGLAVQSLGINTAGALPAPPGPCKATGDATTGVCAQGGQRGVELNWTLAPEDSTLQGYQIFAQQLPGNCQLVPSQQTISPQFVTVADVCGGSVPPTADGGTPMDGGPVDATSIVEALHDSQLIASETGTLACGGSVPSRPYSIDSILPKATSSVRVAGLQNGVSYHFWVAAVDLNWNASSATDLGIAAATPTQDFYGAYRADGGQAEGGYCFVATAAYGDYDHPYVRVLRDFRDRVLEGHSLGRDFVAFYYRHSPPMADFIRRHPVARTAARVLLFPVVVAAGFWTYTTLLQKLLFFVALALSVVMVRRVRARRRAARRARLAEASA